MLMTKIKLVNVLEKLKQKPDANLMEKKKMLISVLERARKKNNAYCRFEK